MCPRPARVDNEPLRRIFALMPRSSSSGGRSPTWAWVVIAVGAVILAVGLPMVMGRGQLSQAEVSRMDAEIQAMHVADQLASRKLRVLVIGDSYTGGSNQGGEGASSWPRLVAADMTAAGYDADVSVLVAGGGGYTAQALGEGTTFVDLVRAAPEDPYDLVVVFGSRNDTARQAEVKAAASELFAVVRLRYPEAELLVIGPPWVDENPPPNVIASRDAVASAATETGAAFVDPLADGWFAGEFSSLIGTDGIQPTDDGHRHMADLIRPIIEDRLFASTAPSSSPP